MVESSFDIIDHTADIGIIVYGADFKQLVSNAALALFSLITDVENIERKLKHHIEINSENRDDLFVEWLNELIYLFDAEHLLFNRFDIDKLDNNQLKAVCFGEKFNSSRHRIKMGVKAATYHMLEISGDSRGYKAQVIFDI